MNTAKIELSGPEWAAGCDKCSYGIVAAPEIISFLPLSEGRAGQAAEDMILFCDCRAGFMYRQHLRKVFNAFDPGTRAALRQHAAATRVPTIHYEPAPPPATPTPAREGVR